jgi:hemolysin-activating ACP:hemolysin acyltransferase
MFFGRKLNERNAKAEKNGIAPGAAVGAAEPAQLPGAVSPSIPSVADEVGDEESKRRMAAARHASATFGEIVTLLMRTPEYKSLPLTDLELLVVPPLLCGQVSVATIQSKTNGTASPVGAILWARVSPEVAKRLASRPGEPTHLAPEEWMCGDIVWVAASAGEGRVLSEMIKLLSKREWAGKDVRIVVRPKDGKPTVATLAAPSSEAA